MFLDERLTNYVIEHKNESIGVVITELHSICRLQHGVKVGMSYKEFKVAADRIFKSWDMVSHNLENHKPSELILFVWAERLRHPEIRIKNVWLSDDLFKEIYNKASK